ncbi:phosphomevalonate kinase [Prorops nasuta]|uniref:phosphomevalonate kinase n=1 Tax=Prorops nasuta TaxID=863751 RepID=UPI0034CE1E00
MTDKPERIFLFSGKRKSGKDHITDILYQRIGPEQSVIIKISGPIKTHWARTLNLDIDKLLGDGEYKEKYRLEMVKWSEDLRRKDYGYFCRAAINMYNAQQKAIWIISDIRRKTDIKWFTENFETCKTVRISCDDSVRKDRGWIYTPDIDDSETECDLDNLDTWDLEVTNNGSNTADILNKIIELI